jgi:hypothetical protein
VKARLHRADGDIKDLGYLIEWEAELVVEHDDRPVLQREPGEPTLQLVTEEDAVGDV